MRKPSIYPNYEPKLGTSLWILDSKIPVQQGVRLPISMVKMAFYGIGVIPFKNSLKRLLF
jgi:hypothetical protein